MKRKWYPFQFLPASLTHQSSREGLCVADAHFDVNPMFSQRPNCALTVKGAMIVFAVVLISESPLKALAAVPVQHS